jgi:hypothetical protein
VFDVLRELGFRAACVARDGIGKSENCKLAQALYAAIALWNCLAVNKRLQIEQLEED